MTSKYRTGTGYRPVGGDLIEQWEAIAVAMFVIAALTALLGFSTYRDAKWLDKTAAIAAPVGSTQV